MPTINPYLTFKGNCEEAFNYYKSVFGGEFSSLSRFSEMPPQEGVSLTEEQKNQIMHVSLPLAKDSVLMGSDSGGDWAPETVFGNNVSLSITADSKEQADQVFEKLSKEGRVTMPLDKTFWGDYFGMCTDRFGINWMLSYNDSADRA